jgi:hypothetical protein
MARSARGSSQTRDQRSIARVPQRDSDVGRLNRSIYFERPVVRPDHVRQSEMYREAMKQDC